MPFACPCYGCLHYNIVGSHKRFDIVRISPVTRCWELGKQQQCRALMVSRPPKSADASASYHVKRNESAHIAYIEFCEPYLHVRIVGASVAIVRWIGLDIVQPAYATTGVDSVIRSAAIIVTLRHVRLTCNVYESAQRPLSGSCRLHPDRPTTSVPAQFRDNQPLP